MKICKGKSVPLQAWSGPEGSRKLRFPDFMTSIPVKRVKFVSDRMSVMTGVISLF